MNAEPETQPELEEPIGDAYFRNGNSKIFNASQEKRSNFLKDISFSLKSLTGNSLERFDPDNFT